MKLFLVALVFLSALSTTAIAQPDEAQIKEIATQYTGDYCVNTDIKCHFVVLSVPSENERDEWVLQVDRSVDVQGWPLFYPGALQIRFDRFGKMLGKRFFSPDN